MRISRTTVAVAILIGSLVLTSCSSSDDKDVQKTNANERTCSFTKGGTAARPVSLPSENPDSETAETAIIKTSEGDIPVVFNAEDSPCAVHNMVHLAKAKFYDQTPCHRVSNDGSYILQCGDPSGTGKGGPGYQFEDEFPVTTASKDTIGYYSRGTLAMANSGSNTNGSQFFLVYGDSPFPSNYTIFGTIDEPGLKVLERIGQAGVADGSGDGSPAKPITIESISTN